VPGQGPYGGPIPSDAITKQRLPGRGKPDPMVAVFPNGEQGDQADPTSQALDWFKQECMTPRYGLLDYYKQEAERIERAASAPPKPFVFTRADALREFDGRRLFGGSW
jgi:hypothetical protein